MGIRRLTVIKASALLLLLVGVVLVAGAVHAQGANVVDTSGRDWVSMPNDQIPSDAFTSPFYAFVNWFTPTIKTLVGIAVGVLCMGLFVKHAFKGGG